MITSLHVLITRPRHQSAGLFQAISTRGGQVTEFPTLEIKPVRKPAVWKKQLVTLKQTAHFFIFVSANAVTPVLPYLKDNRVPMVAIGPGTETALLQGGCMIQNRPALEFSTQGLLKLPELHTVTDKNVVIFSGEQSNPTLSETLKQRGAHVFELPVYRRVCPAVKTAPFLAAWKKAIDIVVSTSLDSLKNWSMLLGTAGHAVFKKKPLIVISPSMQVMALNLKLGKPVLLARDATDQAILETLENWSQYAGQPTVTPST